MKWHKLDIPKLITISLPVVLRRWGLVALLNDILAPFARLVDDVRYKMQHDGRVVYLEKVLNESFDMPGYSPKNHEATKTIVIGPGNIPVQIYLYLKAEPEEPLWLDDDVWLQTGPEMWQNYYDFTVKAPQGLSIQKNKIIRLVNFYKMAGKKYKIVYV